LFADRKLVIDPEQKPRCRWKGNGVLSAALSSHRIFSSLTFGDKEFPLKASCSQHSLLVDAILDRVLGIALQLLRIAFSLRDAVD
jgi:hypothetical protein